MVIAAMAACLAAPACSGVAAEPDGPGVEARLPRDAPSIIGDVREVKRSAEATTILVEQVPTRSAGVPAARITVDRRASVLRRGSDGTTVRASAADLAVGTRVQVWFTGAVAESHPVQATAGTVLIEG